ncbi:MAG TPA: hypothetical protein VJ723_03125, partial [Candidatus Angelobacter sp.]|nr:hypothetical protein [Candidatus Angelobacter sp.]
NTTTKGTFRNLKIDLTAPKTSLKKGESTELHVEVSGLEGLHQPIPLQLTNQSPNTVNLGGGNTQTIVIQPSQVSTGGTFVKTVPVTGIRSGSFVITSDIPTGLYVPPAPAPGATRPPPSTTPPPTAPPSTKPAPPGPSPAPTFATTLPAPSQNTKFYDSFCKEEIDCCKKARAENADGSLRFVTPPWGNGFQLQGNKLIMVMDGKRYEWLFTQDGEPFDIEWMFCHLNTDQIISQLTSVMVQRVMGGDINETGSTVIVSLFGPYVDEKTRRPSYGFQFQAQKSGTNVKEYGVSFSMDAATCTWSFQLFAEDHTGSYSTGPPGSPLGIYQSLFLNDDLNGSHAYLQGQWWATMYRLAGEMQQWSAWLSDHPDMAQVAQLSQDFGVWRNKVQNALNDLRGSASPADQQLFNQMDSLLSIQNPTPQQMVQIFWKFNNLWMRYRQGVN